MTCGTYWRGSRKIKRGLDGDPTGWSCYDIEHDERYSVVGITRASPTRQLYKRKKNSTGGKATHVL